MTSGPDPQKLRLQTPSRDTWLTTLGDVFTRVVLFGIDGTTARVTGVKGLSELLIGTTIPLAEQTPLRWAIEAASPIVGAGRSPSGEVMAKLLTLAAPRAFAVVPLVANKKLAGLAYGDCGAKALPLASVADVFAACERLLNPHIKSAMPDRVAFRSTSRREARVTRTPRANVAPREGIRIITLVDESDERPIIETSGENWSLADLLEPEDLHEVIGATHVEQPPPPPRATQDLPVANIEALNGPPPVPAVARLTEIVSRERPPAPSPLKQRRATERAQRGEVRDTTIERSERGFRRGRRLNPSAAREAERPVQEPQALRRDAAARARPPFDLSPFDAPPLIETPHNAPTSMAAYVDADDTPTQLERPLRRTIVIPRKQWLSVAIAVSAIAFVSLVLAPRSTGNVNERLVTLPAEASALQVGKALAEAKLVRNAAAFAVIGGIGGAHGLRAGTYRISTGRWPWQVAFEMRRGERDLLDVTIPEGLTLAQVAKRLEVAKIAQADTFMAAAHAPSLLGRYGIPGTDAQGWLAGGPYAMARGIGAPDVASVMIDRFMATLAALPETKRLEPDALNDILTLASIVEREATDKSESARIAGLFMNRLRLGMRLESRATALYIIGTEKKELTLADVRQPSPYNTFLNAGLPPAPIANPSLDALRAALHPEEHGYFYMTDRDDGSGQHIFSATYEEHLKAQRANR